MEIHDSLVAGLWQRYAAIDRDLDAKSRVSVAVEAATAGPSRGIGPLGVAVHYRRWTDRCRYRPLYDVLEPRPRSPRYSLVRDGDRSDGSGGCQVHYGRTPERGPVLRGGASDRAARPGGAHAHPLARGRIL